MDKILASSIAAVIAPFVTYFIARYLPDRKEQLKYPKANSERLKKLLSPYWEGQFDQENEEAQNDVINTFVNIDLNKRGRMIIGAASYTDFNNNFIELEILRGFFDGRILKFEYENKDKGIFQKGSAVLTLDDRGENLNGNFVGYSPTMSKVVTGKVTLSKQNK